MAHSAPTEDRVCRVAPRWRRSLVDALMRWLPRRAAARRKRPRPGPLGAAAAQDSGARRELQDYRAAADLPRGRVRQQHATAEALRLGAPRP